MPPATSTLRQPYLVNQLDISSPLAISTLHQQYIMKQNWYFKAKLLWPRPELALNTCPCFLIYPTCRIFCIRTYILLRFTWLEPSLRLGCSGQLMNPQHPNASKIYYHFAGTPLTSTFTCAVFFFLFKPSYVDASLCSLQVAPKFAQTARVACHPALANSSSVNFDVTDPAKCTLMPLARWPCVRHLDLRKF